MRTKQLALITFVLMATSTSGQLINPASMRQYTTPTSYSEITAFVKQAGTSPLLDVRTIGSSVEGRDIYALCFSETEFGKDPSKAKVLIFAQQHGNEQSGKEAVLLLTSELLKEENKYLLKRLDIALIPQVNPDGSETNKRRNANDVDLNRNHLILNQPETMALHKFFDDFLFHATVDVHEYSPYGESWEKYGFRKNASVTLGALTNPNINPRLLKVTNNDALPTVLRFITERGFSSAVYTPGGPPGVDYIRHSTFDINDGRQSFGIQNTFSFIQEGMNGTDTYVKNLAHRAAGQLAGLQGFLNYLYENHEMVINIVNQSRAGLLKNGPGYKMDNSPADRSLPGSWESVTIQAEHVNDGRILQLPVVKFSSPLYDTYEKLVMVKDYRSTVKSLLDVTLPYGYLIPVADDKLMDWIKRLDLITEKSGSLASSKDKENTFSLEEYAIEGVDSVDFERDIIAVARVKTNKAVDVILENYLLVPTAQLKGLLVVQALEPQSMLGLPTYEEFRYLMSQSKYPVIRVCL